MKNDNIIDYINIEKHSIKDLPNGINVSTMTASIIETELEFNFDNIYNYLPLSYDDVLAVVRNQDEYRAIFDIKKKKKNEEQIKRQFFNQYSVIMRVNEGPCDDINKEKKINFKLFVNGSIQMSGFNDLISLNKALNKLISVLGKSVGLKYRDDKKIYKINFVKNIGDFDSSGFKLNMINSNYKIRIKINRSNLYQLLLKKKVNVTFEKAIRACVCVKYNVPIDIKLREILFESFKTVFSEYYNFDKLSKIVDSWDLLDEKKKIKIVNFINQNKEISYKDRKKILMSLEELFRVNKEKSVSIFIFQKGNIIITGAASSKYDIMSSFNFINEIILNHIDDLIIDEEEERENNIKRFYNEVIFENSHKLHKIFPDGILPKLFALR